MKKSDVKKQGKKVAILAIVAAAVACASGEASAGLMDFSVAKGGSSISYAGGQTALTGTNINVFSVTGRDTTANAGITPSIIGGSFSFKTGNYLGHTDAAWQFASGGSVALTGGVDFNGNGLIDGNDIPLGSILFSGTLDNVNVITEGTSYTINGVLDKVKNNDAIPSYYGFAKNLPYKGSLSLKFTPAQMPVFFNSEVDGGTIGIGQTPIPGAVWLLGSGIVALAAGRRGRSAVAA